MIVFRWIPLTQKLFFFLSSPFREISRHFPHTRSSDRCVSMDRKAVVFSWLNLLDADGVVSEEVLAETRIFRMRVAQEVEDEGDYS